MPGSRTRASLGELGDLTSTLNQLSSNIQEQAKAQAVAYAWSLYDQYQTQIWLSGIALGFWIVWVSTRDTCPHHSSSGASA